MLLHDLMDYGSYEFKGTGNGHTGCIVSHKLYSFRGASGTRMLWIPLLFDGNTEIRWSALYLAGKDAHACTCDRTTRIGCSP